MAPVLIEVGRLDPLATSEDLIARRCARELESRGLDWRPLARAHGLDLAQPRLPGMRILVQGADAFLREAARLADDPRLGWKLGDVDLKDMGVLGYSVLNEPDVRRALQLLVDHAGLLSEAAQLVLQVTNDEATLAQSRSSNAVTSQIWLRMFLGLLERLCGPDFEPLRVGVYGTDARHLAGLARHAGLRAEGGDAPVTFVTFPAALLERPVPGADPSLARTLQPLREQAKTQLRRYARELAALRDIIVPLLTDGGATLPHVAMALGMAPESLRKKLGQRGLRLTWIVDAIRADLATTLLAKPNMTLSRAAEELGYRSTIQLTRAYRRWWAAPPRDGRGRHLQ